MDTPERNQIGTPLSKIEESPFSNFINSLSPINPTKSIHVSQTFGSLSFTSPPSVFTSPHVSLQKDCKFLRSLQVSDLEKSPFATTEGSKESKAREITNSNQQSEILVQGEGASASNASAKPLEDSSKCTPELERVLSYDNGNPHSKYKPVTSSGRGTQCEADKSLALVPFIPDSSARSSFRTELNTQNMNHDNEEAGCDWQSLIACSSDLFIFDSPDVLANSKGLLQKSQERANVYDSLLSRFTPNQAYDMQNSIQVGSNTYNEAQETAQHSTQTMVETEMQQIDQAPENLDTSTNEFLSSDSGQNPGKEAIGKLHRGMRRCLTFEMPRTQKSLEGVLLCKSLSTLQTEENRLSCNRQPVTPGADSSRCILPGIGLHLNALTAASKDCGIPNQRKVSLTIQDPLVNSSASSLKKDERPAENVLESAEDSSQASRYAFNEELNPNSPKKRRKKTETIGEDDSCKRCNCKKSKCLKLYCECFAAGVYCVEPCSCQDCFNKPIHEDTVLATRKQIESRNPLAFAPKVIRTTDSAQEDSMRTPASARHKRGCNCKKSNCLKKYCECYQGGVGCSINCRCESCKNAFGRKDGSTLIATEPEMEKLQASENSVMDKTSDISRFHDDENQYSEFAIPKTPSKLYRSSVPVATSSKGKQPTSSENEGAGRSSFVQSECRNEEYYEDASIDEISAVLQNMSSPSSGLKTLSPNTKRVSPPHHGHGSSRKLILRSIPSFPSLSPRQ